MSDDQRRAMALEITQVALSAALEALQQREMAEPYKGYGAASYIRELLDMANSYIERDLSKKTAPPPESEIRREARNAALVEAAQLLDTIARTGLTRAEKARAYARAADDIRALAEGKKGDAG